MNVSMELIALRDDLIFNQPGWILFADRRLFKKLNDYLSQIRLPIWESLPPIYPMGPRYPIYPVYSGGYSRKPIRNFHASVQPVENSSLNLFKEEYKGLELKKLLCVQYSMYNGERKFLVGGTNPKYRCNLCCYEVESDLKNHFTEIIHSERLQLLTEMYDPVNAIWLKGIQEIKNEQLVESPSLSLFKKKYQQLELKKLACVQFSINNGERKFLIDRAGDKYKCNLCCCEVRRVANLKKHFNEIIHSERLQLLTEMYDPINGVWLQSIPETKNAKILDIKHQEKIVENKKHEKTLENRQQEKALESKQTKEKLTTLSSLLENFKKKYFHLDDEKILNVRYSVPYQYRKFMVDFNNGRMRCNMCGCFLSSIIDLRVHLKGARHSKRMDKVVEMYDPLNSVWLESAEKIGKDKLLEITQRDKPLENQEQDKTHQIKQQEKTMEYKLTNEELNPTSLSIFKNYYIFLAYDKLLEVQYSNDYKNRNFMVVDNIACLHCIMCDCNIYSIKDLRAHFKGMRHSKQVDKAVEMYDPMKCVWLKHSLIIDKEIKGEKLQTRDNPGPFPGSEIKDEKLQARDNPIPLPENGPLVKSDFHDSSSLLSLFKVEYCRLELENLLNVQYSINDEKKFMIEHVNDQYECNLCFCKLESVYSLKKHINEIIHTQKVEYLKEIYDPVKCIWLQDKQTQENLHTPPNCLSERITQYEDFKITYSTSSVAGFQYKLNNCDDWFDMLSQRGGYFSCVFCNIRKKPVRSFMRVFSHIKSMSHWNNIPKTVEIFHPEYCLQSLSQDTNQTTNKSAQPSGIKKKSHLETNKHNLDDFKQLYVDLPIEELLKVQYQVRNDEWDFLLDEVNERYYCRLCQNVELAHEKSVQDHIRSLYHSLIINQLSAMYHPTYCVSWDVESSCYDELRLGLYERNNFKWHSHNTDFDIVLEEFKQNYIDLNLDELLNVQYQLDDNHWGFMFTELFDGYYCNLCEVFLHDFEYNVDIHILGQQHLDNIKNLTALYHPEYCTFESDEFLEENEGATNTICDDEVPDSILRQFTMDYVNLSTDEMMQIVYEMVENEDWEYMIHVKDKQFFCRLCGNVAFRTDHELEKHIREIKHKNKVKNVSGLYHPTYCFAEMDSNEDSESTCSTLSELPDENKNFLSCSFEKTCNFSTCDPSKNLLLLQNELSSNGSSTSQSDILIYEELDTLSTDDEFFQEHSILDESTSSDDI